MTIAQIKKEMVSERRNELIAELLHRVHFIEKWGRGIKLILSKEPDTDFKEVGTHFITVFKRKVKSADRDGQKVPVNVPEKRISLIIEHIKGNKQITIPKLASLCKVNQKTIKRDIAKLKQKGLLKRIGPDKGGYWNVLIK